MLNQCSKHEDVNETLKEHGKRIHDLEIKDAEMGQKIKNLIEKLDSLTNWIKALVMLGGTSLVGFFFWYIQTIGGN